MDILIYGDKATDLVKPYNNLINEGLKPIFDDEISELDFYQEKSGMIKSVRLYDVYIRFEFGDDYDKILMGDYCYTDNYSSIQNLKELAHRQGKPYSPVNTIGNLINIILAHLVKADPNDLDLKFRINLYRIAKRNYWNIDIYNTNPYDVKYTNPKNENSSHIFLRRQCDGQPTGVFFTDLEDELKSRLETHDNSLDLMSKGPLFKFLTKGSLQNTESSNCALKLSTEDNCALKLSTEPSVHFAIEKVIFNDPATIVLWKDGSKTIVKVQDGDTFDKEKGLAMALLKKLLGNNGSYYKEIKRWTEDENDR